MEERRKKYTNLQAIKFLFRRMKFQTKVICEYEKEGKGYRLPLVGKRVSDVVVCVGNQLAAY